MNTYQVTYTGDLFTLYAYTEAANRSDAETQAAEELHQRHGFDMAQAWQVEVEPA